MTDNQELTLREFATKALLRKLTQLNLITEKHLSTGSYKEGGFFSDAADSKKYYALLSSDSLLCYSDDKIESVLLVKNGSRSYAYGRIVLHPAPLNLLLQAYKDNILQAIEKEVSQPTTTKEEIEGLAKVCRTLNIIDVNKLYNEIKTQFDKKLKQLDKEDDKKQKSESNLAYYQRLVSEKPKFPKDGVIAIRG